jgi:hypothetical protein
LKRQKEKLEELEKKELGVLVNVIKNKKQIENKTKELTFSTAKNNSRLKKKKRRKKEGSIYSMDVKKPKHKKFKKSKEVKKKFQTNLSSRKKIDFGNEENAYNFVQKTDIRNSNM